MIIKNAPIQDVTLRSGGQFVQSWIKWFGSLVSALNNLQNENGGIIPVAMADADAANNTIYYSTDSGKLTYSDLTGVKHALY